MGESLAVVEGRCWGVFADGRRTPTEADAARGARGVGVRVCRRGANRAKLGPAASGPSLDTVRVRMLQFLDHEGYTTTT